MYKKLFKVSHNCEKEKYQYVFLILAPTKSYLPSQLLSTVTRTKMSSNRLTLQILQAQNTDAMQKPTKKQTKYTDTKQMYRHKYRYKRSTILYFVKWISQSWSANQTGEWNQIYGPTCPTQAFLETHENKAARQVLLESIKFCDFSADLAETDARWATCETWAPQILQQ